MSRKNPKNVFRCPRCLQELPPPTTVSGTELMKKKFPPEVETAGRLQNTVEAFLEEKEGKTKNELASRMRRARALLLRAADSLNEMSRLYDRMDQLDGQKSRVGPAGRDRRRAGLRPPHDAAPPPGRPAGASRRTAEGDHR